MLGLKLNHVSKRGPSSTVFGYWFVAELALQWCHNERDGISNHRDLDCLLNRVFRSRSKKTSKLRVTGLCEGNPSVTGGFPSQMHSNAENCSIRWHHHGSHRTCRIRPGEIMIWCIVESHIPTHIDPLKTLDFLQTIWNALLSKHLVFFCNSSEISAY